LEGAKLQLEKSFGNIMKSTECLQLLNEVCSNASIHLENLNISASNNGCNNELRLSPEDASLNNFNNLSLSSVLNNSTGGLLGQQLSVNNNVFNANQNVISPGNSSKKICNDESKSYVSGQNSAYLQNKIHKSARHHWVTFSFKKKQL
jgi:hypothetical protein